jgi:hypothetical protein
MAGQGHSFVYYHKQKYCYKKCVCAGVWFYTIAFIAW